MVSPKNRLAMGYTVPFIVSHFSRARSTSWAKKGPADTPVAMAKGRAWASSSGSISFSPRAELLHQHPQHPHAVVQLGELLEEVLLGQRAAGDEIELVRAPHQPGPLLLQVFGRKGLHLVDDRPGLLLGIGL